MQEIATEIALAESGLNPSAKNSNSSASGIFQWLKSSWKHYGCKGSRFNYEDNIKCALYVMKNYGFDDWLASKSLWYGKLSQEAKEVIATSIVDTYKPIIEHKVISFVGGVVVIDNLGNILDKNIKIWYNLENKEIPFI